MKDLYRIIVIFACLVNVSFAQESVGYMRPPKQIADLLEAEKTPSVSINISGTKMIMLYSADNPSIEEISQPELRLAGLRINPRTNGQSRSSSFTKIIIKDVKSNKDIGLGNLPENAIIENFTWSPNEMYISFTITTQKGLELWFANVETGYAKKLSEAIVNDVFAGLPYQWNNDSKSIYVKTIPANRATVPLTPVVPAGPVIQSNTGGESAVRTYQDLLRNKYDEELFEYFATSQILKVDLNGVTCKVASTGIIASFSISPNGNYMLVNTITKPFSYTVPYSRFPFDYSLFSSTGTFIKQIEKSGLSENLPKGRDAVRIGKREIDWRNDKPAELFWVEALDNGDPMQEAMYRDQLFFCSEPFDNVVASAIKFKYRFRSIIWGDKNLAFVYESDWLVKETLVSKINSDNLNQEKTLVFQLNSEDKYSDPGIFELTRNNYGRMVLLTDTKGEKYYLTGSGASTEGDRPFIDEFDIRSSKIKRLWRSEAPYYAYCVKINPDNATAIIRKESVSLPPNYFSINFRDGKTVAQLTNFTDPYPSLKGVKSEVIYYQRKDGVKLSGKLYLPANYNPVKDGTIPVLMWAYPNEFNSADAAGQISGSPYQFIRLRSSSPIYWVSMGYAIFDNPSFPIIAEGSGKPNDTFIEQLVANAEAAVNTLVEMKIADPRRIAVGGHSYGAFMVANLLAHTDLFAAGIARSGAYNRTLTPFGFQSEERSFWEAPEIYQKMSPFSYADKIKEPLLLIHGEADNNSGTFPMQSERFFGALKGNGATVRLVMLPNESHGYAANESIMHMAWEMTNWLETYVKNRKSDQN